MTLGERSLAAPEESNPRQQHAGPLLYRLSYIPTPTIKQRLLFLRSRCPRKLLNTGKLMFGVVSKYAIGFLTPSQRPRSYRGDVCLAWWLNSIQAMFTAKSPVSGLHGPAPDCIRRRQKTVVISLKLESRSSHVCATRGKTSSC